MIYVNIGGRLGNQFFRYAFARQLQINNPGENVVYNFDDVNYMHCNDTDGYENTLRYFKTRITETKEKSVFSPMQYVVHRIFKHICMSKETISQRNVVFHKWVRVLEFFGLYYWDIGYYPFKYKKPWWVRNLIVNGCFESEKYLDGVSDFLKEEFRPQEQIHDYNKELMHTIQNNNSVAVCVRRGDFLDSKNADMYNVCGKFYFERAIEAIKQRVTDPVFVFFF